MDSTDSHQILRLRKYLESHLKWGTSSKWHSSMFKELSDDIFNKCNVVLSIATLKRFFGVVNYKGTPSINTLDTLSQYADFDNWRAFKLSNTTDKKSKLFKQIPGRSLYVTLGFFIAVFMIFIISNKRAEDPALLDSITFSSRAVTNSFPNSVVFDFDLKNVKSDSLYIQQYWDASKTIKINDTQKQATGIYYFPGYFRAKLILEGQIVKEHDLFLRSEGWLGTLDYSPVPKYFNPATTSGVRLICLDHLIDEVKNLKRPITSTFHYINDLGNISGDNFRIDASIKTLWNEKWAICETAYIYIIGTKGAFIVPFSKIGCVSDIGLMLNDLHLSGKEHDLTAFATNLSDFTNIRINVDQKKVDVSINDKVVYTGEYLKSMGRFVGLRFKFLGVGEVESFSLIDPVNGEIAIR